LPAGLPTAGVSGPRQRESGAAPPGTEGGAPLPGVREPRDDAAPLSTASGQTRYRGQLFRLFLLVEHGDSLFIVDQHAAHERILFETMKARRPVSQELLMPIRVEAGAEGAAILDRSSELLERLGIRIQRSEEDRSVEITALPEELLALDEQELVQALMAEKGSLDELEDRILSLAACRLAVKEGEELDASAAAELARRVFELDNARCPHGRPIWVELGRDELERRVGRE
jgi:DNA mismatch repair protein MutL